MNKRTLYVKGTVDITMFDVATDDVVYSSNKLQSNQIQTSVNLGAVQGGLGNPTLINLPDTPNLTLSMTAADFSLEAQGLQVGATPSYNAIVPVSESVTCTGGKLTVSGTPVAPLGTSTGAIVGVVDGTAYTFSGQEISFPAGTNGTAYCVKYYVQKLQSKQLTINTQFAPMVVRALIAMPVFSSTTADVSTGSRVGTLYVTVPRLQLNGDINIDASQTTASTTVLNATALSFDEYQASSGNACAVNEPKLAYMALDLTDENSYDHVVKLVVIGGGVSGENGDTVENPVLLLMDNGETQPIADYSDFTWTGTAGTVNTTTGIITLGSASGDIAVAATQAIARPDLVATINVEIS